MNDEVSRPGRRRGASPPWRLAVLLAGYGLVAHATPGAAQPVEPADWWLAESPGTSGARFGLGLDFRFEDLDSLLNTAFTETVTPRDPQNPPRVIPGDPALNNRKFDYRFEVRSWGAQAPIALPRWELGGRMTLFPSLILEVATTEVTFDFRDRTEPEQSTSITGRGVSYGAGFDAVALGREGKWFLGGGYRFRTLPDLDLERSPPVQFFDLDHDEVRLDQDTHLASLRLGRVLAGGRVTPWVGARGRWTELEIDDRLGFANPASSGFDLRTRSRFESDSALGVAGVDAWLGGQVAGRAEVSFGDGDVAALLKVVYLLAPDHDGGGERRRDDEEKPESSPEAIASALVLEFERIEAAFEARWKLLRLEAGARETYRVDEVRALLEDTEADLLAALEAYPQAAPLSAYIRDRFEQWRTDLQVAVTATRRRDRPQSVVARRAKAGLIRWTARSSSIVPAMQAGVDRPRADGLLGQVLAFLQQLVGASRASRLTIERVCIKSIPSDGVRFIMWAKGRLESDKRLADTNNWIYGVWRGKYCYTFPSEPCAGPGSGEPDCELDLWNDPRSLIECDSRICKCRLKDQPTDVCE